VRAVVSALSRGVQNAPLQQAACSALAKLAQAAPANRAAAGAAGVTAVLATLRTHPGDADVQCAACFALSALTVQMLTLRGCSAAPQQ
jgi:hypothetical protein